MPSNNAMLDLLKTRRSVAAAFLGAPGPDAEQLDGLLTIASRVPDHGKLTPWRYIVFEGSAREKAGAKLADLLVRRGESDAQRLDLTRGALARAPVVIAVVSTAAPHVKIPQVEQVYSAVASCMTLVIAAHAMGFAANWLTEWFSHDAEAKAILGVGASETLIGFVHIGTPKEAPADRPRPALETVVTRWGD